jgi:lipopolysaccharide/colanic/teichoic acid biosynthesis glycosyltransferase
MWQRATAALGLLITAPALGVAAAVIKRSDPGPVLYRAARAGVGGRPFLMYKLRTMRVGTDGRGSITAATDDRIFRAGRWLRRLKLDELPQLINIVRGDMAIVGPRPEAIDIVRDHYQSWMTETLDLPPGLTGPGSLHYIEQQRGLPADPAVATEFYARQVLPLKLCYELVFVRSRSVKYELRLIIRTLIDIAGDRDFARAARDIETTRALMILADVSESGVG